MRSPRFTESQVVSILKEADAGMPVKEICRKRGIRLMFIQPGKPAQNAYIERFNRTVRHEWLDAHLFESIDHAQKTATDWLWRYNNERPNMANGGITQIRKLAFAA
jgi:putative transposase